LGKYPRCCGKKIEALAVTKADKTAFTGQIAAMSGSLRAMVNDMRHADHVDMRNHLKSIAAHLVITLIVYYS
jgi:hypothetical protein